MKTLLLCAYRDRDASESPLGLEADEHGRTLIERRIDHLQRYALEVVCVLAGADADEQLRRCPRIANTELAFDDSPGGLTLMSNIRAGLSACEGEPCLVLPVEVPLPPARDVRHLIEEWGRAGMGDQISLVRPEAGASSPHGFPLLVTRFGAKQLSSLPDLKTLVDTRLKYLHVALGSDSSLASRAKPA